MKSRTFCCNKTLLKKALQRGLPLWGIYLLCWIVALPLNLISSSDWMDAIDASRIVLQAAAINSHVVPFLYGLAVACLLFSYLYKSRSANFFGALPLRRETHFITNYTAGLLYALLPNLVIALLTLLAGGFTEAGLLREVCIWYGLSAMAYVFFFSFATLCAMLVGHLAALPILYGIANFMVIILEGIIGSLLSTFVFGMYYNGSGRALAFSPVAYMLAESVPDVHTVWEQDIRSGVTIEGWPYVLVLFCVGILFAVLAFLLRKGRRMESAGDVIAVHRLKPLFLYCFTIGCSLVIGYVLAAMLENYSDPSNFILVLVCMLVGAFLGYFGGQMMLHKSFRVFRKQYWVNFAVVCVVISAVLFCFRLDLFGYSRYIPDEDRVESISLNYGDSQYTDDPELIAKTISLHEDILAQQHYLENWDRSYGYSRTVYLNYKLTNGNVVRRRYNLPVDDHSDIGNDLLHQYEDIYNDPVYILERNLPSDYSADNINYAMAWDQTNSERTLTARQAYRLLKEGVEEDIRAGVLETRYWSKDGPTVVAHEYLELHVEVTFDGLSDTEWNSRYCSFSFNTDCANSLRILKEYGFITTPVEAS